MFDFFGKLFQTSDFPARWKCGNWETAHGWLHILADLGIWSAYLAIPIALVYFAYRKENVPFRKLFWLFGAFILVCGTTHLLEAIIFYWPAYRLLGLMKLTTAVISWTTVMVLIPVIPRALNLRTPEELKREIEDRKQIEMQLRASQAQFRSVVESALDAIITIDDEHKIIGWNRGAQTLFQYEVAEILGKPIQLVLLDDFDSARTAIDSSEFDSSIISAQASEIIGKRKSGETFFGESTRARWDDQIRVYTTIIIRDISERRRALAALAEREQDIRTIFESAAVGICKVDLKSRKCVRVNDRFSEITGYRRDELQHLTFSEITHPEDRERDLSQYLSALQTETNCFQSQKRYIQKSGRIVWVQVTVSVARDRRGRPLYTVGVVQDITEKIRSEEAIRLRDRAIEAMQQGVCIADATRPETPIIYVNRGFEEITGYTANEVLNRNCRFLQGERTDPESIDKIRTAVREGRSCKVELLNYRKDGSTFWNTLTISPVRDPSGKLTHFVAAQTDTSDFRQLEEQFRQSQKMEAVGHLAGGVAHDFNNLLTVINGYSELLLTGMVPPEQMVGIVSEVHNAGIRAANLTRQLLAFSRKTVLQPRVLNLNELIVNLTNMLTRLIGEDIQLHTELHNQLGKLRVDPGQMEQMLLNLVVNARDAMPQGGQLTVKTEPIEVELASTIYPADFHPGRYVCLTIADTGTGMSPETRARLFEPFFTTKGVGKGTGLGLATVFGIVKQSGGHILVDTELGRGTSFRIFLPEYEYDGTTPSSVVSEPAPRGDESILLVEDDERVRAITAMALRKQGYTVHEANCGEAALNWIETNPEPFDLLLTDVIMPGMNGRELTEKLEFLPYKFNVLYMSGYTDDAVVRNGVLTEEVYFLQKPFTVDRLLRKVRKVLDQRSLDDSVV